MACRREKILLPSVVVSRPAEEIRTWFFCDTKRAILSATTARSHLSQRERGRRVRPSPAIRERKRRTMLHRSLDILLALVLLLSACAPPAPTPTELPISTP